MGAFLHDLRGAVRTLRMAPGFTGIAVATLALGIGSNAAILSLISSLLLRPLPVTDPQRLALVSSGSPTERVQYTYTTFDEIRRSRLLFDGALAFTDCCGTAVLDVGGDTQAIDRQFVSGDFFETLGVRAFRGRLLTPSDDQANPPGGPVAVVSYRLWRGRLGGRDDLAGRPLTINRVPVTIVGVMPPQFPGIEVGRVMDLAMPYRLAARFTSTPFDDDTAWLNVMVRLRPGVSIADGGAALRAVQPQLRAAAMPKNADERRGFLTAPLTLESAARGVSRLRERFERPLLALLVIVVLVLLIAAANVGNLFLVRGIARSRDFAVRIALGATRWQLVRCLVVESLLLSTIAAALGVTVALPVGRAIVARLSTLRAPIVLPVALDWRVLACTAALMAAAAVLFGVAPAFRATAGPLTGSLSGGERTIAGDPRAALSSVLIVVQVAVSVLLIVAAGLFVQTFERLAHVPLGFEQSRAIVVTVSVPTVQAGERARFFDRIVRTVAAVPGVAAAGGSLNPPIVGELRGDIVVSAPGTTAPADAERVSQTNIIAGRWIEAYGMTLRDGRELDDRDTAARPGVMLVNEAFARRFSRDRTPLGRTFAVAFRAPGADVSIGAKTIAGIVADSVTQSIRDPVRPAIYLPLLQWEWPVLQYTFFVGVRSVAESPVLLERSVRSAIRSVSEDATLTFEPLSQQVDESLAEDRVLAGISAFFGLTALLLAGLGLYGVIAQAAARRTREIGVRMALGSSRGAVVRLVLGQAAVLVAVGLVLGVVGSVWVVRFAASLLYGVSARDPITIGAAAALLAAGGLGAAWIPARRAAGVDPTIALRAE